jgi:glycosyltransferase involved in cell wall biosynthesis
MRSKGSLELNREGKVLLLVENDGFPSDSRVVNEAKTLASNGYKVSVVCPRFQGQKLHEVVNCISVYRYPPPRQPRGLLGYFWEYPYSLIAIFLASLVVFLREGFDVIHTQNPPDFLFVIGLFYKIFGKKFIFDHNDLTPELYLSRFGNGRLALNFLLLLEKLSCRFADVVITTGKSYEELEITRDKISRTKVVLVRNSPNLERIKDLSLSNAPITEGKEVRLGYVGYLSPQDGVDLLLKSLFHLAYSLGRQDFHCLIIGDGEMLDDLKKLAQKMSINRFITFVGRLPWEEAMKLLATVNICLEPNPSSPFNDKTATVKVLEYMALQKAIVAYDLKEQRSLIEGAALLAHNNDESEFAKKVEQLMDDRELRESMAAAGRKKMEKELNWTHSAANLLCAYENLIKKGN